MTDLRDLSKLPEDAAYWEHLEARILDELLPVVRNGPPAPVVWWAPLAAQAWRLGGVAVAAAIAALLLVPRAAPQPASQTGLLRMPEDDSVLVGFISASAPPPLASLLLPVDRRNR